MELLVLSTKLFVVKLLRLYAFKIFVFIFFYIGTLNKYLVSKKEVEFNQNLKSINFITQYNCKNSPFDKQADFIYLELI